MRLVALMTQLVAVAQQLCAHVCVGNQQEVADPLCSQADVVNDEVEVEERVSAFLQQRRMSLNQACQETQNGLQTSLPCCQSQYRLADFPWQLVPVKLKLQHINRRRRRRSEELDDLETW